MVIGAIIAGRYRVIREVGRGGMGVVYQVQHLNTGETLALKSLLSHSGEQADILERFKREMRAPALIKSEHVVRITDADVAPELNGSLFLVMELLDGSDLERLLQKRGAFSGEEVVWLLGQAARGLDKAHAVGIIHRDLKPENLFLHRREDGGLIVKLLDFGIARLSDRDMAAADAKVTKSGAILGTPMYLSPEQAMGEPDQLGPHSDVWSVGLIVFELLVGAPYFQADGVTKLIGQICFQPLPPASARGSSLGPAFDRWFERSCTRDYKARWPSVGTQVAALADALGLPASLVQGQEPPGSLVAALRSHSGAADPEATLFNPSGPSAITASRELRTTTSEGRGQSASRLRPPRWLLGLAGALAAIALLGIGALIRERTKQEAALSKDPKAPAAMGESTRAAAENTDGGTVLGSGPVGAIPAALPEARAPASQRVLGKGKGDSLPASRKKNPNVGVSRPPTKRPAGTGYDPVAP